MNLPPSASPMSYSLPQALSFPQSPAVRKIPAGPPAAPSAPLSTAVRVLVRLRPVLPSERAIGKRCSLFSIEGRSIDEEWESSHRQQFSYEALSGPRIEEIDGPEKKQEIPTTLTLSRPNGLKSEKFSFDSVLTASATQSEVFEFGRCSEMIAAAMRGFHATIFAYGMTSSGKTHTMDGIQYSERISGSKAVKVLREPSADEAGVSLRCIEELFKKIQEETGQFKEKQNESTAQVEEIHGDSEEFDENPPERPEVPLSSVRYTVRCSFVQIYQESVFDLLSDSSPVQTGNAAGLKIKWDSKNEFFVENLYISECSSASEAKALYFAGLKRRIVASHKLNAASSRSHCLFTLYITRKDLSFADSAVDSRFTLVDLAGSERQAITGADGLVLKQSIGINKSLFALRKVIKALSKRSRSLVPYRDSALTRLLKHSLGGSCLTLMIACLQPLDDFHEENLSTLNYAALTKKIANSVSRNEDPKILLIKKLKEENRLLRELLARAKQNDGNLYENSPAIQQIIAAAAKTVENAQHFPLSSSSSPSDGLSSPGGSSEEISPVDTKELAEKFIESVSIIKQLLDDNNSLRELLGREKSGEERNSLENSALLTENQELQNRLHFLESVILQAGDGEMMKECGILSPEQNTGEITVELSNTENKPSEARVSTGFSSSSSFSEKFSAQENEISALKEEIARLKGIVLQSEYQLNQANRELRNARKSEGKRGKSRGARGSTVEKPFFKPQPAALKDIEPYFSLLPGAKRTTSRKTRGNRSDNLVDDDVDDFNMDFNLMAEFSDLRNFGASGEFGGNFSSARALGQQNSLSLADFERFATSPPPVDKPFDLPRSSPDIRKEIHQAMAQERRGDFLVNGNSSNPTTTGNFNVLAQFQDNGKEKSSGYARVISLMRKKRKAAAAGNRRASVTASPQAAQPSGSREELWEKMRARAWQSAKEQETSRRQQDRVSSSASSDSSFSSYQDFSQPPQPQQLAQASQNYSIRPKPPAIFRPTAGISQQPPIQLASYSSYTANRNQTAPTAPVTFQPQPRFLPTPPAQPAASPPPSLGLSLSSIEQLFRQRLSTSSSKNLSSRRG